MALKIGELFATLVLHNEDFKAKLSDAQGRAYDFGTNMQKVGAGMTAGITAPLALAAKSAVDAFAEQDKAQASLTAALGKTGAAADAAIKSLGDYATELQHASIYGDEAIMEGMALVRQMGVQESQLKQSAKAALGLAAAYDIDLHTAFQLIGKAAAGNTATLGRYGIQVSEAGTAQEKFAQILELGAGKFAAAEAQAKTTGGAMKQAANEIGDAWQEIGAVLAPLALDFAKKIQAIAAAFIELPAPAKTAIVVFGAIAAAVGPLLMVVGSLIKSFLLIQSIAPAIGASWTVAMGPVGWVIAAIAAVAAGAYLIVRNWSSIKEFFSKLWQGVKDSFAGAWDWIVGKIKALAKFLSFGKIGGEIEAPTPAAAAAGGAGAGTLRVASAGGSGANNSEMLKELKRISRNTERKVYA